MKVKELIKELKDLNVPNAVIQNEFGYEAIIHIEFEPSEVDPSELEVWMKVE